MSRISPAPEVVPDRPVPIPEPPPGVHVSYIPDIGPGYDAAAEWCASISKIPVTGVTIKKAVINRRLPRTILTGKMWFSSQDLWTWILGHRGFPADDGTRHGFSADSSALNS